MPRMVNRYRRWRERSQADRGFDGEPPLHAGHFGLGMRHWDAQYPPGSPKPPGKSSPPADRIGYAGQFASPGYPDALRTDRRRGDRITVDRYRRCKGGFDHEPGTLGLGQGRASLMARVAGGQLAGMVSDSLKSDMPPGAGPARKGHMVS